MTPFSVFATDTTNTSLKVRIAMLAIFPFPFTFLTVFGAVANAILPTLGDIPLGISALLSAAIIIDAVRYRCVCKTQASTVVLLTDIMLAASHVTMFVITQVVMGMESQCRRYHCYNKEGLVLLAGYGNLFFLVFAAAHVYLAIKSIYAGYRRNEYADRCEDCNSIAMPRFKSFRGLGYFGRRAGGKEYAQLSVQDNEDPDKGRFCNEDAEGEDEAMLKPSTEEHV
ncbi:hypothetical protein EJ05DRAFT_501260 [Pseudovirgaria hyperparasitica]|uniref:MARVEL domain-containing protein n=1 Tax=Pseudovirgaria hyperparasitica TaxID=470096 RepID=A0A6A6W478_9PEZI|nr:uncharacterized protein EJ05DRAFT_501260 [Pseudovirgaria hyperparasitica]KAF2757738.1 hypothetical protein EJ05DRAFT_501260 [Pseudovirgaria hyperparasitica]